MLYMRVVYNKLYRYTLLIYTLYTNGNKNALYLAVWPKKTLQVGAEAGGAGGQAPAGHFYKRTCII